MQNKNTESRFSSAHSFQDLRLGLVGAVMSVVMAHAIAHAEAANLSAWNFDSTANQLEITVKQGVTPRYFLMAQPARIIVDLPDTSVGAVKAQQSYTGSIRQIRVSQFQPGLTRIVMEVSPTVSLAPGQVQLQKVGNTAASNQSRWVLRPLIAGAATTDASISKASSVLPSTSRPTARPAIATAPTPVVSTAESASPPLPAEATPLPPESSLAVNTVNGVAIAVPTPVTQPLNLVATNQRVSATAPSAPPVAVLQPTTQRLPEAPAVAMPTEVALTRPTTTPSNISVQLPASDVSAQLPASDTSFNPAANQTVSVRVPALMAATQNAGGSSSLVTMPAVSAISTMPPAAFATSPTVSVPPLQPAGSSGVVPQSSSVDFTRQSAPGSRQPSVVVPPLQPQSAPIPSIAPSAQSAPVVEFGQPLPIAPGTPTSNVGFPSDRPLGAAQPDRYLPLNVLLPAGSTLSLRYPGDQTLNVRTGSPHPEVLLLQSEIRNAQGAIVAPEGSMVLGQFETSNAGSKFVTQAIAVRGRKVPLMAESNTLGGNSPKIADNKLAVNSGIGALAGGIIGGLGGSAGWGIVGGAATGAAVTYLTAPKPAVIQPGQMIQVRLLQDLPQP